MSEPSTLVSDHEREAAIAELRTACLDGRLTLEEYSERVGVALAARTRAELAGARRDLPAVPRSAPAIRKTPTFNLLFMGDKRLRGRWIVPPESTTITVMGDYEIDLRDATIRHPEVTLTVVSLMGDVKIIVPEGVEVDVDGFAIMGDTDTKVRRVPAGYGAPRVRIRAISLMGDIKVRSAQSRR